MHVTSRGGVAQRRTAGDMRELAVIGPSPGLFYDGAYE